MLTYHAHVILSPLTILFSMVTLGWVPIALAAASMIASVVKKKKQAAQAKKEQEAKAQQWELTEKPQIEAAQRRSAMKSAIAGAIARARGLDKILPGFWDKPTTRTPTTIANPYRTVGAPGFDWGGLLGDAVSAAGSAYSGMQMDKAYKTAFAGNKTGEAMARLGIPSSSYGYGYGYSPPASNAWRGVPYTLPFDE